MHKTINTFARTNKVIGRSQIIQPKVNYKGNGIKWFDDSKLIRKDEHHKNKTISK